MENTNSTVFLIRKSNEVKGNVNVAKLSLI